MQVTGDSKFRYGTLAIKGDIHLGDDYPADFNFQMDQLDLNALWKSYFRGRLTGTSAAAGTVQVRGPLRHPGQWTLEATLPALRSMWKTSKFTIKVRFAFLSPTNCSTSRNCTL